MFESRLTRTNLVRWVATLLVAVAGLAFAGPAKAAIRVDAWGGHTCWNGDPRAWAPNVASSGYVAWRPVFVWVPSQRGVATQYEYGQFVWAYRDSAWRSFAGGHPWREQSGKRAIPGNVWVYNQIYDYDSRSWSYHWSNALEMNPLTGTFYTTGLNVCGY